MFWFSFFFVGENVLDLLCSTEGRKVISKPHCMLRRMLGSRDSSVEWHVQFLKIENILVSFNFSLGNVSMVRETLM